MKKQKKEEARTVRIKLDFVAEIKPPIDILSDPDIIEACASALHGLMKPKLKPRQRVHFKIFGGSRFTIIYDPRDPRVKQASRL